MNAQINLVTIWTDDVHRMKKFFNDVIGFDVVNDLGTYVEFANEGVRFAICSRSVMTTFSSEYAQAAKGQSLELAFPCDDVEDLEETYSYLLSMGVEGVMPPTDMPWHQRTALFKDPDGNIHEIFTDIE